MTRTTIRISNNINIALQYTKRLLQRWIHHFKVGSDSMHFYQHFTIHDIPKKFVRPDILTCGICYVPLFMKQSKIICITANQVNSN